MPRIVEATTDEGETVLFAEFVTDAGAQHVELDFMLAVLHLRETDEEAFEFVWDLVLLANDRGAPAEAMDA